MSETLGGPVAEAVTQPGGMSPGAAARLVLADRRRAFVKAVGSTLNPDTPALFRHEIVVLSALARVPYRPDLLATYDDGDWVAILLADVEGRLAEPSDADAVLATVRQQAAELTPAPVRILTLADRARARWLPRWTALMSDPARYLPSWAAAQAPALAERVRTIPDRLDAPTLCHWDVRNDNTIVRPDGSVVFVDWGMSCLGPVWADELCFAFEWSAPEQAADLLAEIDAPADLLTDILLALGGMQAYAATLPAPPGLPTMPAFRAESARRLLGVVERRLS